MTKLNGNTPADVLRFLRAIHGDLSASLDKHACEDDPQLRTVECESLTEALPRIRGILAARPELPLEYDHLARCSRICEVWNTWPVGWQKSVEPRKAESELRAAIETLGAYLDVRDAAATPTEPEKAESTLPFDLERCDVPKTLNRPDFGPVTISNDDQWKLMKALMAAWPNAVPESKLKHIFQDQNTRDNTPKQLRQRIDSLGLTVKDWVLTELED